MIQQKHHTQLKHVHNTGAMISFAGGTDFIPLEQFNITFPAYSPVGTQINKAIEILPDSLLEDDPEILKLVLNTTDLPAVVLGAPSEATVLITEHNADG